MVLKLIIDNNEFLSTTLHNTPLFTEKGRNSSYSYHKSRRVVKSVPVGKLYAFPDPFNASYNYL